MRYRLACTARQSSPDKDDSGYSERSAFRDWLNSCRYQPSMHAGAIDKTANAAPGIVCAARAACPTISERAVPYPSERNRVRQARDWPMVAALCCVPFCWYGLHPLTGTATSLPGTEWRPKLASHSVSVYRRQGNLLASDVVR